MTPASQTVDNNRNYWYSGGMPKKLPPDRVRSWPFVSFSIRPEALDELTALARRLGRSRADLLRDLVDLGLPWVQAMARHRGDSIAPASEDGANSRDGTAAPAVYADAAADARRSA